MPSGLATLVVEIVRELRHVKGEREVYRLLACAAIHQLHDLGEEARRRDARYLQLLEEHRALRAATRRGLAA